MAKIINWSERAQGELKEILLYFNNRNGNKEYSQKLLNEVKELLTVLSQNEFIGRLTTDKSSRVISMNTYSIFYDIINNNIVILSFWDNRQNTGNRIDQ